MQFSKEITWMKQNHTENQNKVKLYTRFCVFDIKSTKTIDRLEQEKDIENHPSVRIDSSVFLKVEDNYCIFYSEISIYVIQIIFYEGLLGSLRYIIR